MRLLHADKHTESIGHGGEQYERDEHGAFELPHELAAHLLERFPHLWSIAPDPEPTPAEDKPKRSTSKAKPEPKHSDGDNSGDGAALVQSPADEPVKEGDGDAPAPAAPEKRAPSRKASA